MTREIRLAFAHPEERAEATSGDRLPDRISLRDYVLEADIGAFQQERGRKQRVQFNVVVEVADQDQLDDDVDRILSYDRITEAIEAELGRERLNLLETLAERVAERILIEPQALRAFIRIEKLDLGPGALGVEIVRSRTEVGADPTVRERPEPIILHLSQRAVWSASLPKWLDSLEKNDAPVILTVGFGPEPRADAKHKWAQRRIDLLALEQAAWVLAGRDPRCVVVDTRTELDWAAQHGRISVWAPSKMVLDATDKPDAETPEALAVWLAAELDAARLVFVGTTPPEGSSAETVSDDVAVLPLGARNA